MSETRPLFYYGGDGWGGLSESGTFQVVANETKVFTNPHEARKYYESLHEEKACWDITRGAELIECHVFTELSDSDELPF